jgi:hypothetical protein
MQHWVNFVFFFFSFLFSTVQYSKRGVSELAQSLAVFANLRVLEIRENPGVGGP